MSYQVLSYFLTYLAEYHACQCSSKALTNLVRRLLCKPCVRNLRRHLQCIAVPLYHSQFSARNNEKTENRSRNPINEITHNTDTGLYSHTMPEVLLPIAALWYDKVCPLQGRCGASRSQLTYRNAPVKTRNAPYIRE